LLDVRSEPSETLGRMWVGCPRWYVGAKDWVEIWSGGKVHLMGVRACWCPPNWVCGVPRSIQRSSCWERRSFSFSSERACIWEGESPVLLLSSHYAALYPVTTCWAVFGPTYDRGPTRF
jgi:hypothetical protein